MGLFAVVFAFCNNLKRISELKREKIYDFKAKLQKKFSYANRVLTSHS